MADEHTLDGNAIGGILLEVFGLEMTPARGVCRSCGAREQLARTDVYVRAPGIVVRCRHCEGVLLRIVRSHDRAWIDLSGIASLEISTAASPGG
jgi:hypothetical protein